VRRKTVQKRKKSRQKTRLDEEEGSASSRRSFQNRRVCGEERKAAFYERKRTQNGGWGKGSFLNRLEARHSTAEKVFPHLVFRGHSKVWGKKRQTGGAALIKFKKKGQLLWAHPAKVTRREAERKRRIANIRGRRRKCPGPGKSSISKPAYGRKTNMRAPPDLRKRKNNGGEEEKTQSTSRTERSPCYCSNRSGETTGRPNCNLANLGGERGLARQESR